MQLLTLLVGLGCVLMFVTADESADELKDTMQKLEQDLGQHFKVDDGSVDKLKKTVKKLEQNLGQVTRQLMLNQYAAEEKIRTDGYSGIKQVRTGRGGVRTYFSDTHTGRGFGACHNHANNERTVGMGEVTAVLNGVEFRTRHNDYSLSMPHTTSKKWGEMEKIPFPEVPPSVTDKVDVNEQIDEMREYFRAWQTSNVTHRNFTDYFKPVMCYLEGTWTMQNGDNIDEPFPSDRHQIDADGWFDLQERNRLTSYTGGKSVLENLAFLPTTIMRLENRTQPVFAQWNYRIACHPIKKFLPINQFKVNDDLSVRMKNRQNMDKYTASRAAHFLLRDKPGSKRERPATLTTLDEIMEEIPGKDNYQGKIFDEGFDSAVMDVKTGLKKDVSKYHRWFKLDRKDAMGIQQSHRGFSDQNLYAAKTTQDKVAGIKMKLCRKAKWDPVTKKRKRVCKDMKEKWSYAIPLEIIYMTPLSRWNPYGIAHMDGPKDQTKCLKGKSGSCEDADQAYTATCRKNYYRTPKEFFEGGEVARDKADTTRNNVCFLGSDGKPHAVTASGIRVVLPNIKGVGNAIRTRWPIAPVHTQGSTGYKNYDALKDVVMEPKAYPFIIYGGSEGEGANKEHTYLTGWSTKRGVQRHQHSFVVTEVELNELGSDYKARLTVDTSQKDGHMHTIVVRWHAEQKTLYVVKCDNKGTFCWDKHQRMCREEEGASLLQRKKNQFTYVEESEVEESVEEI